MANAIGISERHCWRTVAGVYILLFAGILWRAHGLPYTIDNNESFASLQHARNLHDVSWSITKGLADEVTSRQAGSSPFVHTHQGNVPRIFAYLIYLFGARTVESQIVVTTFTVGLLSVWLAYRLLRSIGPPGFATLGCLVLITDYGLYGQWQVNTYRVWYGFFFFSSLLWVRSYGRRREWKMFLVGILNFAAMSYGEYVYAAFVGITAALYACILYRGSPGKLFRMLFVEAAGVAVAGGTLLAQLTAYMGWENVKRDIHYTLSARNMAFDQAFADEANQFYARHHIVFFNNYLDTGPLRHVGYFFLSLFRYHLQYSSSWICLSALVILAGALLGCLKRATSEQGDDALTKTMLSIRAAGSLLIAAGIYCLLQTAIFQMEWRPSGGVPLALEYALFGCAAFAAVPALSRFRPTEERLRWLLPPAAVIRGAVLLSVAISMLMLRDRLFDAHVEQQWSLFASPGIYFALGALSFVGCTLLALAISMFGSKRLLDRQPLLAGLLGLSVCVSVGYAVVYRVFTGYMFSGYLYRQAPFIVFWTDALIGASVFLVLEFVRRLVAERRRAPAFCFGILLVAFAGGWVSLQAAYWRAMPPTSYSFLHLLKKAPFRGRTFVANTYAAPIAEETRAWAYAETSIFSGQVTLDEEGFSWEHDSKYLWFADAEENAAYSYPDYGIEVFQPASIKEALEWANRAKADGSGAPQSLGIAERSESPLQAFLQDQLMASDGPRYTIIKFDWDFPPFLKPIDESFVKAASIMSLRQKMAVSKIAQEFHRYWRIQIEPLGRSALEGPEPIGRLVESATINNAPFLSQDELKSCGKLVKLVEGEELKIQLHAASDGGRVRVTVNEMSRVFDLRAIARKNASIELNLDEPYGTHTSIPNFPAGLYVKTALGDVEGEAMADITYRFAQQKHGNEESTTVRIYHLGHVHDLQIADTILYLGPQQIAVRIDEFREENPDTIVEYARVAALGDRRTYEQWLLDHLMAHPGELARKGILQGARHLKGLRPFLALNGEATTMRRIPLSRDFVGWEQISVTPGTRSKEGPEYFGLPFRASDIGLPEKGDRTVTVGFPKPDVGPLPYGVLNLRVRFPAVHNNWAEPIVATGVEDAGDFVYVIYPDAGHIRIGFDHWFSGGPLTPPLAIDFAREHRLEVSMGSLFPSSADFLFEGISKDAVTRARSNLTVVLDGATVLDSPAKFYSSTPDQVTVGQNLIKGTTSNALFTGDILEQDRIWPVDLSSKGQSGNPKTNY